MPNSTTTTPIPLTAGQLRYLGLTYNSLKDLIAAIDTGWINNAAASKIIFNIEGEPLLSREDIAAATAYAHRNNAKPVFAFAADCTIIGDPDMSGRTRTMTFIFGSAEEAYFEIKHEGEWVPRTFFGILNRACFGKPGYEANIRPIYGLIDSPANLRVWDTWGRFYGVEFVLDFHETQKCFGDRNGVQVHLYAYL